jgi:hypothetical protein
MVLLHPDMVATANTDAARVACYPSPSNSQQVAKQKNLVASAPNPKCIQVVLSPVITSKSTAIYSPSHPQGTMFLFQHLDQQYNLNSDVVLGIEALLCEVLVPTKFAIPNRKMVLYFWQLPYFLLPTYTAQAEVFFG